MIRGSLRASAMGLAGLVVLGVVFAACQSSGEEDESGRQPAAAAPPASEPTSPQTAAVLGVFEGSGDGVTPEIDLQEGVVVLKAEHQGASNFDVNLLVEEGESTLSVEAVGSYAGERAHQVSAGRLRIEVKADGPWKIEVSQPQWEGGQEPPLEFSGQGDGLVGPILLSTGLYRPKFTHSGSGDFIVELLRSDGPGSEQVVEHTGKFRGNVAVKVGAPKLAGTTKEQAEMGLAPGSYILTVRADGDWTVEFPKPSPCPEGAKDTGVLC